MKKLLLFITVALLGISVSSCLNLGKEQFSETPAIVYISQDKGRVYGKTLAGRIITSDKMQIMHAGDFKIFSYQWEESYGYTPIGNIQAHDVVIGSEIYDIDKTHLIHSPVDSEAVEHKLVHITSPSHDPNGIYLDDNWLFQYTFEGYDGDKTKLNFNVRDYNEDDNLVSIDIRLNKYEEGKETASTQNMSNFVAVDLNLLRMMYLNNDSRESINIKFYYHKKEGEDPVTIVNNHTNSDNYIMHNNEQDLIPR